MSTSQSPAPSPPPSPPPSPLRARRPPPPPLASGAGGSGPRAFSKVQETALEALTGKESCVAKGYYPDRFLRLLRPPAVPPPPLLSPLIRRGYFTRVSALEHIVAAFLGRVLEAALPNANLVLLGAGLDTLSFRLLTASRRSGQAEAGAAVSTTATTPATAAAAAAGETGVALACFEVDLAPVARYKATCLRASPELMAAVGGEEEGEQEEGEQRAGLLKAGPTVVFRGQGGGYALIAGDLGDTTGLEAALDAAGLDWAAPTLLVAECVLVYMPAEDSQRLVRWAASRFGPPHSPGAALVSYDMILPHDAFGRVMRANLKARGLELPGFEVWGRDLGTQLQRFLASSDAEEEGTGGGNGGWERAVGGDMNAVYQHLLAPGDRERAQRLEGLDEVEEWQMLMGHYCYVTAMRGALLASMLRGVEGFEERQRQV